MASAADAAGFREFASPHALAVGRLAARLTTSADRDRVVNAAMATAARQYPAYVATSRTPPEAWLLSLVAERARRFRPRWRSAPSELVDLPTDALERDRWSDLDGAIASLPWGQRLVMELFYVLGLDLARCAAVVGSDEDGVAAKLAAARRWLIDGVEEFELS